MASSKIDIWNMALRRVGETATVSDENDTKLSAMVCREEWDNVIREVLESRRWRFARRQWTLASVATQSVSTAGDDSTVIFAFGFPYLNSTQVVVTLDDVVQTAYSLTQATGGADPYVTMTTAPATGETLKITVTVSRVGWDYVYALPPDYVSDVAILPTNSVPVDYLSPQSRPPYEVMIDDEAAGHILCTNYTAGEMAAFEYIGLVAYVPKWPASFVTAVVWRLASKLAYALTKDTSRAQYCEGMYAQALSRAKAQDANSGHRNPIEPMSPSELARDD